MKAKWEVRQLYNYIRFHWWKLSEQKLYRFYVGGYITEKQYKKLAKWYGFSGHTTMWL
jgi:hypothetical protein